MTLTEILDSTRYQLDKSGSHALADFQPEDLAFWADEATKEFIKLRYGVNNNVGKPFEVTQKRIEDLKSLVISTDNIVFTLSPVYNVNLLPLERPDFQGALPVDLWIFISMVSYGNKPGCALKLLRTKQVSHDEISTCLADPFNKPNATKFLYLFESVNNMLIFVMNGMSIPKTIITYLRKPKSILATLIGGPNSYTDMNQQLELPDITHNEIVKLCVKMILENIESGRYQTILNEYKDVE